MIVSVTSFVFPDAFFVNVTTLIPVVAYILGSIPFGLLVVKAFGGADIRSVGSGNIGAANVTRNAGPIAGALTLLFDAGKGYLAVWIAGHWTGWNIRWMMLGAIFAVIGHVFPVWPPDSASSFPFAGRQSWLPLFYGSSWSSSGVTRRSARSPPRLPCRFWSMSFTLRAMRPLNS
jgi:hypothetical protein